MSALAPNPQTASGTPGMSDPALLAAPSQQLPNSGNPFGTVGAPAGAYTDSQYLAAEANLRATIGGQYNDLLQQLGYTDPTTGQFIPGTVSQNAQQQEDVLNQGKTQAITQNTQNAQQNGILYSGMRGTMQAQAETPYEQQIGALELQTPQQLSSLYGQAGDLVNQYHTQNMQLLADAAGRQTAAIDANPVTAMAGGGEVNQATPALIGEQGPEAVVPRTPLTDDENDLLTMLRQTAQSRMGGQTDTQPMTAPPYPQPIQEPHSFGPPLSGAQPAPIPGFNPGIQPPRPIHLPEHPAHDPVANVLTAGHHLQMAHHHLQRAAAARLGRFAD